MLELIQKYLPKSGSHESVGEILSQIRMECHNPFFFSCIVLDDADIPIGFVLATVSITRRGKRIFIEHMHAPNLGMADKLHEMMMAKLGVDDVWWLTHRDPSAWIKFCKKRKHPVELYGWMIRTERQDEPRV